MYIRLICVGKLKEGYLHEAEREYIKRLGAFCRMDIIEIPEQKLPDRPGPAQIEAALKKEAGAILQKVPEGATLVSLCVEAEQMSSERLKDFISDSALSGASKLAFVIGGSYGLHDSIKEASKLRLSMSEMTFPHHLARIMLLEQIYRAYTMMQGSKYHK